MPTLTPDQVILVVGFLMPLLIAVVKKDPYPAYVNALIALVAYVATAVVVTFVQTSTFKVDAFVTNFILVFGSGTVGYAALWKASLDPVITAKVNGATPPPAA